MRRRRQFEARTYLGRDLHSRVVAEMLARNRKTISATVRELLAEYFAMREELTTAFGVSDEEGEGANRIGYRLLTESEGRISRSIEMEGRRLGATIDRLVAMVEQLDLDLMIHLPEITEDLQDAAAASGRRRHREWLVRVDERCNADLPPED